MSATGSLAKALAAFQAEMPTVAKSKTAKVGQYSYTYAGLAEVSHVGLPLLSKHGLSFSCCPRRTESNGYELAAFLMHESGEEKEGSLPISGGTPQQLGSAITYARRYLFGSMTGLVTEDDDDGQIAAAQTARGSRSAPAAQTPEQVEAGYRALPDQQAAEPMTAKSRGAMFAEFNRLGIPEANQLAGINSITGQAYTSRGDLTDAHAKAVIADLKKRATAKEES